MSSTGYVISVDPSEMANRFAAPEPLFDEPLEEVDEARVESILSSLHFETQVKPLLDRIPDREADLIEQFEAVDDAAAAATATDLGSAEFHGVDAIPLEADVTDGNSLTGQLLLGGCLDDGGARTATKQQRGGV